MSCVLTVQTKRYGAITAFDLLHEGRLVASLIKESTNLVDYSRRRIFQDLDTAMEFYLTQVEPEKKLLDSTNRLSNGSGGICRSSQHFVFSFTSLKSNRSLQRAAEYNSHPAALCTWVAKQNESFCPCHASTFSIEGQVLSGPNPWIALGPTWKETNSCWDASISRGRQPYEGAAAWRGCFRRPTRGNLRAL